MVNGQQYCFHTDGSVLTKGESSKFCMSSSSTLPVITDKDIDNVFQRFINDSVDVSGSDMEQMNNSVWLDAQARHVDDSVPWHWIGSNQPSTLDKSNFVSHLSNAWCAAMGTNGLHQLHWNEKNYYICQYHITRCGGYRAFVYRYNSTCYITHAEQVNWFTAVNRCLSKNGSLAVFDDQILTNNSWYTELINYLGKTKRQWIGLIKSRWTWPNADGANVLYNKFNETSSDNTESDYNCVVATSGYWRLARCTDRHRVVCQSDRPIIVDPVTPATASPTTTSQFPHSGDDISSTESRTTNTDETASSDSGSTVTVVVAVVVAVVVVAAIVVVVVIFIRRHFVCELQLRRRDEQPNQQTGASSAGQTSLPMTSTYDSIDPSRSDVVVYDEVAQSPTYQSIDPSRSDAVVYDQIAGGPETASPNRHLYSNVVSKNN